MIRAPDSFVFPAPFNIVKIFLVAPFECVIYLFHQLLFIYFYNRLFPVLRLSTKNYATLNRWVMGIIFFIPLVLIASFESIFDKRKHTWMDNWFRGNDEGVEDTPECKDPSVEDPQCIGLQISKVPFAELIQVFPNTSLVCSFYFV